MIQMAWVRGDASGTISPKTLTSEEPRGVLAAAGFVDVQVVTDTWSEPLSDLADGWDVLLHGLLSGPVASKPANVHQAIGNGSWRPGRPRHPAMIRPYS
jgi:hypothetical protein